LTFLLFAGCANSSSHRPTPLPEPAAPGRAQEPPAARVDMPPMAQREFRGLWVATYQNLDWPSRPGLDAARQKADLITLIDRAAALHLNAIVFQVRPGRPF
jgi:uncharacterized lipoprotein YddW (UPF0748 family)